MMNRNSPVENILIIGSGSVPVFNIVANSSECPISLKKGVRKCLYSRNDLVIYSALESTPLPTDALGFRIVLHVVSIVMIEMNSAKMILTNQG